MNSPLPSRGGGALTGLPTRRDETWRYSDLAAVARVWPVATHAHVVAPGETLVRDIVIEGADDDVLIEDHAIEIGAGGSATFRVVVAGGRLGRVFLKVRLAERARFELSGAILGGGEQTQEIVTRILHAEPNATSAQTVRAILAERATGSYLGKVAVARDAQKSDGSQSVKAMLLDRTATANLKPRTRNLRRRREMRTRRHGGRARQAIALLPRQPRPSPGGGQDAAAARVRRRAVRGRRHGPPHRRDRSRAGAHPVNLLSRPGRARGPCASARGGVRARVGVVPNHRRALTLPPLRGGPLPLPRGGEGIGGSRSVTFVTFREYPR